MSGLFFEEDEGFDLGSGPSGLSFSLFNKPASASSPAIPKAAPTPTPAPAPVAAASPAPQQREPPKLVHAVPGVDCYKYNHDTKGYDNLGKIGVAILQVPGLAVFQLLLYKSNDNHLCQIPLVPQFPFTIQNDSFISFSDLNQLPWTVNFNTLDDATTFAKHLVVAKFLAGKSETVVSQDILPGKGNEIGAGDSLMIKYSVHTVNENKLGAVLATNLNDAKPLRVKVGGGQLPAAVDSSVVGMRKTSRRLIAIPQRLTQGIKPQPDTAVVYQVDIVKVKYASAGSTSSPQVNAPTEEKSAEATREEIIARTKRLGGIAMVPMGEALLNRAKVEPDEPVANPGVAPVAANPIATPVAQNPVQANQYGVADFTQPNQVYIGNPQQPVAQAAPVDYQAAAAPVAQPLALYTSPAPAQVAVQPVVYAEPVRSAPVQQQQDSSNPEDRFLTPSENQKFLNDAKMIHEEIKLTVVNASSKIETLHREIKNSVFGRDDEISKEKISGSVLVQTIQKFVDDNENLQREVVVKSERIDELREKINNLLEKNKKLIEDQAQTLEERNNSLTESSEIVRKQISAINDDKLRAEEELNSVTEQLSNTRRNISKLTLKNEELSNRLDDVNSEISNQRAQTNLLKSDKISGDSSFHDLRMKLREEQALAKRVETQYQSLKEEVDEAKETLQKYKNLMEQQRKKWIQMKADIDKAHEDEKFAAMKKMKAQLLKFKKEKDDAVAEAESIERDTEARWRENINKLKAQFKERVDELKRDTADEKTREIELAVDEVKRDAIASLVDTRKELGDSYKKGFLQAREELISSSSSAQIQQVQKKIDVAHQQAKDFMATTIKSVMSSVYQSLRSEISPNDTHNGTDILKILVNAIKTSTFDAVQKVEYHFSQPDPFASHRAVSSSDDEPEEPDEPDEEEIEVVEEKSSSSDQEVIEALESDNDSDYVPEASEHSESEDQVRDVEVEEPADDLLEDPQDAQSSEHEEPVRTVRKQEFSDFDDLLEDADVPEGDADDIDLDLSDHEDEPKHESEPEADPEPEPEADLDEIDDPLQSHSVPEVAEEEDEEEEQHKQHIKPEDSSEDQVDIMNELLKDDPKPESSEDEPPQKKEESSSSSSSEDEEKPAPAPAPAAQKPAADIDSLFATKVATADLDDVFGAPKKDSSKPKFDTSNLFAKKETTPAKPKTGGGFEDIFGDKPAASSKAKPKTDVDIFGGDSDFGVPTTSSSKPKADPFSLSVSKPADSPAKPKSSLDDIFSGKSNPKGDPFAAKAANIADFDDLFN